MDRFSSDNYFRSLVRGNDKFFVILITDAGYVIKAHNAPNQVKNLPTVGDVCDDENCVHLHTSDKYETYHLSMNSNGKIEKVPRSSEQPTFDENTVKFTRLFRKNQELIHGSAKQIFSFMNRRKIPTSYLLPFSTKFLEKHGLNAEYRNVPILSFIMTSIFSLLNSIHPGYRPLFADDEEQRFMAQNILQRMFLVNPLLHPEVWPITFDTSKTRTRGGWIETTLGDYYDNGDFPRLPSNELMKAVELLSGMALKCTKQCT